MGPKAGKPKASQSTLPKGPERSSTPSSVINSPKVTKKTIPDSKGRRQSGSESELSPITSEKARLYEKYYNSENRRRSRVHGSPSHLQQLATENSPQAQADTVPDPIDERIRRSRSPRYPSMPSIHEDEAPISQQTHPEENNCSPKSPHDQANLLQANRSSVSSASRAPRIPLPSQQAAYEAGSPSRRPSTQSLPAPTTRRATRAGGAALVPPLQDEPRSTRKNSRAAPSLPPSTIAHTPAQIASPSPQASPARHISPPCQTSPTHQATAEPSHKEELGRLKKEREALRNQLAAAQAEIVDLSETISAYEKPTAGQGSNHDYDTTMDHSLDALAQAGREIEINRLNAHVEELEAECENKEDDIRALKRERRERRDRIVELDSKIGQLERRIQELETGEGVLREEVGRLRQAFLEKGRGMVREGGQIVQYGEAIVRSGEAMVEFATDG